MRQEPYSSKLQWKFSLYYIKESKKVFLILMFVIQMSLLKRFLSNYVACFCNGAHTVHSSVKAGKGPAANIV